MKSESLWVLVAGVVFGLALGAAWSPRQDAGRGGGPGGSARSGAGGASGTLAGSPGNREPGKLPRDRAARTHRSAPGARLGDLSVEMLVEVVGSFRDEEDMNMMELARIGGLIAQMGEGEAVGLLRGLTEVKEGEERNITQMKGVVAMIVFTRLCELNGPEAMRMMGEGELGEKFANESGEVLTLGMNSWVAADPDGAKAWMDGLLGKVDALALDGGDEDDLEKAGGTMALLNQEELLEAYMRGMAKHDAEGLASSLEGLRHEEVREGLEGMVFEAVVETESSADGMVRLLEEYDNVEDSSARIVAINKLSALDDARAAEWVEERPVSKERDHLVTAVASDMMAKDLKSGVKWYMEQDLHGEDRQADRLQRITWQWGKTDYRAASRWLERQPDGAMRDGAESGMAQLAAGQKQWTESMDWLNDISDDAMRATAMERVFRTGWNRSEGAMAPELMEAAEAAGFGEAAQGFGGR